MYHLDKILSDKYQFVIEEPRAIYEMRTQASWNNLDLGTQLTTIKNQKVIIHSVGIWNGEAGPDFLNAKLEIDGKICIGDVEVHQKTSDWHNHKHSENKDYDNVILHIVSDNNINTSPNNIPIVIIAPVEDKNLERIVRIIKKGECAAEFAKMSNEDISAFLSKAGLERFLLKTDSFIKLFLEIGDKNAIIKTIFDAMGYKKNRDSFLELYERFMQYDKDVRKKYFKAILWGESGLLPDITQDKYCSEFKDFISDIWDEWWILRPESHSPIKWKRSGGRPLNSPERRVAGLIDILDKIINSSLNDFIKDFENISFENKDNLFNEYINFTTKRKTKASILGKSRILDIEINIIYPAVLAFAKFAKDTKLASDTIVEYSKLRKSQSNIILKNAGQLWFYDQKRYSKIANSALIQQGIIHLYRNLCEKLNTDCKICSR